MKRCAPFFFWCFERNNQVVIFSPNGNKRKTAPFRNTTPHQACPRPSRRPAAPRAERHSRPSFVRVVLASCVQRPPGAAQHPRRARALSHQDQTPSLLQGSRPAPDLPFALRSCRYAPVLSLSGISSRARREHFAHEPAGAHPIIHACVRAREIGFGSRPASKPSPWPGPAARDSGRTSQRGPRSMLVSERQPFGCSVCPTRGSVWPSDHSAGHKAFPSGVRVLGGRLERAWQHLKHPQTLTLNPKHEMLTPMLNLKPARRTFFFFFFFKKMVFCQGCGAKVCIPSPCWFRVSGCPVGLFGFMV